MTAVNRSNMDFLTASVSRATDIAIVTHTHPDGDAMGCSIALLCWLESIGKKAGIVLDDRYPESLEFMVGEYGSRITVSEEEPGKAAAALRNCDLIFCLDLNSIERTESLAEHIAANRCPKILVDHHLNPAVGQFSAIFSETGISSASELLYNVLLAVPGIDSDARKIPLKAAEALLTGMTTDTNNFANSVYPSTFRMASELLAAGADRDRILSDLYMNYRENRFRLLGRLLDRNLRITAEGAAYIIIDADTYREFDIREGETEGFVNMPLGIKNVRMSILLKEEKDRFRVSVRSKKGVSANRFAAEYFNGGGHELASGGKLLKGSGFDGGVRELEEYLKKSIEDFFEKETI